MNIGITGGREFTDKDFIETTLLSIFEADDVMIVGDARGTDTICYDFAVSIGMKHERKEANWKAFGKRAGHIRNAEIVAQSDYIVAFYNGRSNGTKDCIKQAREKGLQVIVVDVKY